MYIEHMKMTKKMWEFVPHINAFQKIPTAENSLGQIDSMKSTILSP